MTFNSSLAAWLGFPVSTALTARLLRRAVLLPASESGGICGPRYLILLEDL